MNKFFLILLIIISVSNIILKDIRINLKHFVDEHNRVRIFHGMNVVYKLPPYIPIIDKFDPLYSLNDDDINLFIQPIKSFFSNQKMCYLNKYYGIF